MIFLVFSLILLLLFLLLNLLYQNEQLCLQWAFLRKCADCRENWMQKNSLYAKTSCKYFFGKLIKVEWVSYIKLDKTRETEVESCFDCELEFRYPKNEDYFERLLQEFKLRSRTDQSLTKDNNSTNLINRGYGENIKRDCLIVMDGVSGLVETSQKFASFLAVARKLMYHCVYIFHTTHPKTYI